MRFRLSAICLADLRPFLCSQPGPEVRNVLRRSEKHNLKHNPFKALVAPRPIAWVSSMDLDGVLNLAPYSFFNAVADQPPTIVFAPNGPRPGGGTKDTLSNIEKTNEFVVNLCSWELRDEMNKSSAHVDPSVDEFELVGLTPAPSVHVKTPRVKEAPGQFGMRVPSRECGYRVQTRRSRTIW